MARPQYKEVARLSIGRINKQEITQKLTLAGSLEIEIDNKLADGGPHLAGHRFSRADLTVASLLAVFAQPEEMPKRYEMPVPTALAADVERSRGRPAMRWVVAQYHAHRLPRRRATQ